MTSTTASGTMDKAEYVVRCAAVYRKAVKDVTDEFCNQMGEACWENRDTDDEIDPERDAADDLSHWDNDE